MVMLGAGGMILSDDGISQVPIGGSQAKMKYLLSYWPLDSLERHQEGLLPDRAPTFLAE